MIELEPRLTPYIPHRPTMKQAAFLSPLTNLVLEVLFGVAWVWLFAHEPPGTSALTGGALVLGALAANEALALRRGR